MGCPGSAMSGRVGKTKHKTKKMTKSKLGAVRGGCFGICLGACPSPSASHHLCLCPASGRGGGGGRSACGSRAIPFVYQHHGLLGQDSQQHLTQLNISPLLARTTQPAPEARDPSPPSGLCPGPPPDPCQCPQGAKCNLWLNSGSFVWTESEALKGPNTNRPAVGQPDGSPPLEGRSAVSTNI